MNDAESIVERLDKRDDAKVVAYREIGLPLFRINSLLTLQEAGSLGAIEEFVLRCIAQAVDTSDDLQNFLGLPSKIVASQLAQLFMEGAINQIGDSPPRYGLTKSGRTRLEDASSARLVKEQMPIYVDGITRTVVAADPQSLWNNAQLESLYIAAIAPTPRRPPRASEVDLEGINRIVGLVAGAERPSRRAVRLDAIVGRISVVFQRAIAVAFKSDDGRRVSIAFSIDGRSSDEHEIAFARSEDAQRSVVFGAMFDSEKRRREAQQVARELRADLPGIISPSSKRGTGRPTLSLQRDESVYSLPIEKVRNLSVYEHLPLLYRAFSTAIRRILVVSPAIRASVVNEEFLRRLATCLGRDIEVTIAYGFGRRDTKEGEADRAAREALEALAAKFTNFRLINKGASRARVLLVDSSFCVVTTFNWLSFNSDPRQPMREDEGTMFEDSAAVDAYFIKCVTRFRSDSESG